jgi:hypothetical protein
MMMHARRANPLDMQCHKALSLWSADCAEQVPAFFEERYSNDDRPRKAPGGHTGEGVAALACQNFLSYE